MKSSLYKPLFLLVFLLSTFHCFAQSFTVAIIIKNQPNQQILLGIVNGDNIIPVDSAFAENELVRFSLPANAITGMYQLNMGQTKYARVMKEPPQTLNFVFNNENIILETDFDSPQTSTRVIQSKENTIWFSFKRKIDELKTQIFILEKELNSYWENKKNEKAINKANEYNQLQIERDLYVSEFIKGDTNLFATQLIKAFKTPILDGYLTKEQRNKQFQKQFFSSLDFNNEALIYSQAYTDNIFNFLISFNNIKFNQQERETAYKKAVDDILENTKQNKLVYIFISNYLVHGFEVLEMKSLTNYIKEKQQL